MSPHCFELIADKLHGAGFSTGWVRFYDEQGRALWCADASRDGQRWIVHAENGSAAFVELKRQARDFVAASH
ncbi:MAG: hypothetical protein ABMA01_22740 [Chthoniobacteraceae bacterium]